MLDERLVGYWTDEDLYQGSMEAADIAFHPDGTGWTYWSRIGGPFSVDRFTWHTIENRRLTLALNQWLSGTWDIKDHTTRHRVTSQTTRHKKIVLTYQIHDGQDLFRRPATLLQTGQEISLGTIGDRFAFKRELAADERDPTTHKP